MLVDAHSGQKSSNKIGCEAISERLSLYDIKGQWPVVYPPNQTSMLLTRVALNHVASLNSEAKVLDICTGSGVVALNLAKNYPSLNVTASDISMSACNATKQSADKLGVNIEVIESNWFTNISQSSFDLITAHAPAVPYPEAGAWEFSEEMEVATNGGNDGADAFVMMIEQSKSHLNDGGQLLLGVPHWANYNRIIEVLKKSFTNVKELAVGEAHFFPFSQVSSEHSTVNYVKSLVGDGVVSVNFNIEQPSSPISVILATN